MCNTISIYSQENLESYRILHGKIVNLVNDLYSGLGLFLIIPVFMGCFIIIQVSYLFLWGSP